MENNIVPEASKYTACSLKVSGTVSSKEAEEVWYPASFLEQDPDPMGCARHICIKKQGALWVVNFFYKGIKSGMDTRLHVRYE